MSKASTRPGVTTIVHSSGCKGSQAPLSDHAKIEATVLTGCPTLGGTERYGPCDADSEGPSVSLRPEKMDFGVGGWRIGPNLKSLSSPIVEMAPSSAEDSDVIDSASSRSDGSLSLRDSDAVDGSYSCLRGDEERLCLFRKAGVKDGKMLERRPSDPTLVCPAGDGSAFFFRSSLLGVGRRFCSFPGADAGSSVARAPSGVRWSEGCLGVDC